MTELDKEFAKEEGYVIWDSAKDSTDEINKINECIREAFKENNMLLCLEELRYDDGSKKIRHNSSDEPFVNSKYEDYTRYSPIAPKKIYIGKTNETYFLFHKQLYTNDKGQQTFVRTVILAPKLENEEISRYHAHGKLYNHGFYSNKCTLFDAISLVSRYCRSPVDKFMELYGISLKDQHPSERKETIDLSPDEIKSKKENIKVL